MSAAASESTDPTVHVVGLRTADDSGLVATAAARPLLSWRLSSDRSSARQRCYEVQTASDDVFRSGVAGSGVVHSERRQDVVMPGPALRSREVRWWRVRVCTDLGWTAWSDPARVEAALLERSDWLARPIALASDAGRRDPGPAPVFRREFHLPMHVRTARLYVTALGVHDTRVNGLAVSGDLLEPGWTSYGHRLLYATYDVTSLLKAGANVISATVGDGWYRGTLTWLSPPKRNVYGEAAALLAQLDVTLADGQRLVVATDGTWRAATGEVLSAGLYEGSIIDLRRSPEGWRRAGFDDSAWSPAVALDLPPGLEQRAMPAVRAVETRRPAVTPAQRGGLRVDAGQNVTGYLRITAEGGEGRAVTVRHAEVLDSAGDLHTAPLRGATSTDRYVLADTGPVRLTPQFTFHGFRYADITADPGVTISDVEVVVVASDLTRTGHFACSNDAVNRLYENTVWSQRGNFLSLPTDCPQRDERLGWTGDIQVFAPTACHTFDSRSFLRNWLRDLAADQREDGCVPHVVPNVLHLLGDEDWEYGSAGWGDAAVTVPWALYEAYGDLDVLEGQYDSMRGWVDWCAGRLDADGIWSGDFHFGDWLDPGAPPDRPHEATTPTEFVATACLAHSARLVARVARLIGRTEDADLCGVLGDRAAQAAWAAYGTLAVTTQTGCAIALQMGIAPAAERERIGRYLADLVRKAEGRIATGFLGTPLVLPALTATGHHDEAYRLLLNDRCPGWLHPVRQGATTVWERWDAVGEDGAIHAGDMDGGGSMVSFNHYAYGAVAAWLYRTVAGLAPDPDAPGYRRIVFAPVPGGQLTWARAESSTPYGTAAIRWETDASSFTADVEIPVGASGVFVLPPGTWSAVRADGVPVAADDLRLSDAHGRRALMLGAGPHRVTLTSWRGTS
ncbi:alpha-L-rhamnosidase [Streptomyces jeddahensis]|nr:alpha-L-rhamnosidase [Streptomyces jeddahensis]